MWRRHNSDARRFALPCLLYAACSAASGAAFAPPSRLRGGRRRRASLCAVTTDAKETSREVRFLPPSPASPRYTEFYKEGVLVGIARTAPNARRITGELLVDAPAAALWEVLTDYDGLSQRVPNLVESRVLNPGGARPRVYQRGAQKIFGFEFGADVTLDMTECAGADDDRPGIQTVEFACVDSPFFSQFDGAWTLEPCPGNDAGVTTTRVRYAVDVRPQGPVPVAALEWRIREDVPTNVRAVARAARALAIDKVDEGQERGLPPPPSTLSWDGPPARIPERTEVKDEQPNDVVAVEWYEDETMAVYL